MEIHHQHLDTFLNDIASTCDTEEQQEDVMDYCSAHGFLTGIVIGPVAVDDATALDYMTSGLTAETTAAAKTETLTSIQALRVEIDRQINSDEDDLDIPAEVSADHSLMDSPLADWCAGFVEAYLEHEESWVATHKQAVTELLLPVIIISGLLNDEPEFSDIIADPDFVENMYKQLPDSLLEMYLLFHSTDEKH